MSTVETVSASEIENARKLGARNESEILRAVARVTQAHVADCMGVSASTISRALDDLNRWALLLAAAGLQVVPVDSMVVDAHELTALESMAFKYLETRQQQRIKEGRS
ncbi:MarR family transcriptional regulator [Burkholderia multivorans]|uniref:MarR family transcriptional regulator n=1 Tax=Burkholderia multivorans TaxID=87883 RepID=UPI001C240A96|nr:helix-turn-helix domain-containing protein [Burkholderia multivorans]MBU9228225.1 MarR family transcriptional regulator [Burkholderia multivorans]MBU9310884.1 MarR family transcriptional regulator [Burkholderia multivorans]MBU9317239.1 MarR family transcriptional regulator [Burkholderia multivorans]MDN8056346.1 helix-turn-helix domain-containing protein [Burkholderia multivorans]